jgi:phosphatidate phosphatase APP1
VKNIWKNYVTELYDRTNQQEYVEVETDEEKEEEVKVDTDQKGPYILKVMLKKPLRK